MIKINFREEFLEKLKTTRDFSNQDLSNLDLSDLDLRGVNFRNADLSNVNLRNSNLFDANLSDSDLCDSNLFNVNLIRTDLSNADLSNVNLRNANLRNADLTGVKLFSTTGNGKEIINIEIPNRKSEHKIVYNKQTKEVWIGCLSTFLEQLKNLTMEKVEKIKEEKALYLRETEKLFFDFEHALPVLIERIEVINNDKN